MQTNACAHAHGNRDRPAYTRRKPLVFILFGLFVSGDVTSPFAGIQSPYVSEPAFAALCSRSRTDYDPFARVCVRPLPVFTRTPLTFSPSPSLSSPLSPPFDARFCVQTKGTGEGVRPAHPPPLRSSSTGFCMTYDLPYCPTVHRPRT